MAANEVVNVGMVGGSDVHALELVMVWQREEGPNIIL